MSEKSKKLRNLIESNDLRFIMEAHDGMSAKIAEEAGFEALWASGLSVSASLGYRDNNELSFSQVADHCYHIARATSLPVLVDADTMYGDFNTARIALQLFERAGVAGVVIEDKRFPKTNSFLNNSEDSLADADEFALKIKAIKESQSDPDFVVVARLEEFIAGLGVTEAIDRAIKYTKAGADAILVHSKKSTSEDIDAFMEVWKELGYCEGENKVPIIIVPTKYYSVPMDHFRSLGISTVIWANHNMRSAVTSMKNTCKKIFEEQSLMSIEDKIVTVSEIFRLQGNDELEEAEEKYKPKAGSVANAIILAASDLPDGTPKTLLNVNGKPIIEHQIEIFKEMGISNILTMTSEVIPNIDAYCLVNSAYKDTKEVDSLRLASDSIKGGTLVTYGDLIFRKYIIRELLDSKADMTIVIDPNLSNDSAYNEYACTTKKYNKLEQSADNKVVDMTTEVSDNCTGVFIGVFYIKNPEVARFIVKYLTEEGADTISTARMIEVIKMVISKGYNVEANYLTSDSWSDINELKDLVEASEVR